MAERSGENASCAQVRRAHPHGHVELRILASPSANGMAVNLTYQEARALCDELSELLADFEGRTCTCGAGPWSNGHFGRCANCGGASVPEVHFSAWEFVGRRHFTEEQLDEITDYVSKRIAARAGRAS